MSLEPNSTSFLKPEDVQLRIRPQYLCHRRL